MGCGWCLGRLLWRAALPLRLLVCLVLGLRDAAVSQILLARVMLCSIHGLLGAVAPAAGLLPRTLLCGLPHQLRFWFSTQPLFVAAVSGRLSAAGLLLSHSPLLPRVAAVGALLAATLLFADCWLFTCHSGCRGSAGCSRYCWFPSTRNDCHGSLFHGCCHTHRSILSAFLFLPFKPDVVQCW